MSIYYFLPFRRCCLALAERLFDLFELVWIGVDDVKPPDKLNPPAGEPVKKKM